MYFHLSFLGQVQDKYLWSDSVLQAETGFILQPFLFYQVSAVVHTHPF